MSRLPPGLYDLPITNEIARELRQLDRAQLAADERELDPADVLSSDDRYHPAECVDGKGSGKKLHRIHLYDARYDISLSSQWRDRLFASTGPAAVDVQPSQIRSRRSPRVSRQRISAAMDEHEKANRRPVWEALSTLFLDTDVSLLREYRASALASSTYSIDEIEEILAREVFPVCRWNLLSIAGEWAGFDMDWLERQILKPRSRLWSIGASQALGSKEWRATRAEIERRRNGR